MTIDEPTRRELWTSLRSVIGEAQADTLMSMLPVQPLPELATRADIASLRAEMRAELRAELGDLRAEFGDLRAEFGDIRGELGGLRGELRSELARQTVTLALALGSLMVAVLGIVLTLGFSGAFA